MRVSDARLKLAIGSDPETVVDFGQQVPMKRPGQPAELATAYVMLADPLSSYVSGATIAVTGGKPIL
jgi:NAD(P)-dependent dehydrogenase (short-subunit alcohol dehydrogenase family)